MFERKASETFAKFCSLSCYRRHGGESSLERIVRSELDRAAIPYEQEARVGKWSIDFLVAGRVAVEADGSYWHSSPATKRRDAKRDAALSARGLIVIRLAESEVRSDPRCVLRALTACGLVRVEISEPLPQRHASSGSARGS